MIIFISGSVNAGKSSTSKLIAKKLQAEWLDIDELAGSIKDFNLATDIPQAIQLAIDRINQLTARGKTVVANYVLRPEDYKMLRKGLDDDQQFYFTLAPRLEIARSDRGRGMNDWEYERVKYHYDTGVASPTFGEIIDTSDIALEQVAEAIIKIIKKTPKEGSNV